MMSPKVLIGQLQESGETLQSLLSSCQQMPKEWRPNKNGWSMLEIVGHLIDEEIYDFRARVDHSLNDPDTPPPSINPVALVLEHKYLEQDYPAQVERFGIERNNSISWLRSLAEVDWYRASNHPDHKDRSPYFYLSNWVVHDLLHIKQITRLRYDYLDSELDIQINYAGNWV